MKKRKKPDLVVFNEDSQQYDASLKPYGTSTSSPVIKPLNTSTWRNDGIQRVNEKIKSKFDELKNEYDRFIHQFECNELVYNSKFNFEPVIGKTYHLYNYLNEQPFLSIISTDQCNFDHIGSFKLNSDKIWEKV
ncbi:MAG: DUF2452 domain-containing protein [Bacteroidetes bacterium]|nr:DUF2452 domain-containing protein [Bacteroidota bacterium]